MLLIIIGLALVVGLLLGLLGGGGSILIVPVLVYAVGLPAKEAIATSLIVVGGTAAVAAARHATLGNVRWRIGLGFSLAGMVGAWLGGSAAAWFSGTALMTIFAVMMVAAAGAMLRGKPADTEAEPHAPPPAPLIAIEGVVVGGVTGLVGAGGGFLVVPVLVLAAGLTMHEAIGTSLLVIALKSVAGFAGHATHVSVDYAIALPLTGIAIVGSLVGLALSSHVEANSLRRGFAWFVLAMAALVIAREWTAEPANYSTRSSSMASVASAEAVM